jgi:hypothetical protein
MNLEFCLSCWLFSTLEGGSGEGSNRRKQEEREKIQNLSFYPFSLLLLASSSSSAVLYFLLMSSSSSSDTLQAVIVIFVVFSALQSVSIPPHFVVVCLFVVVVVEHCCFVYISCNSSTKTATVWYGVPVVVIMGV